MDLTRYINSIEITAHSLEQVLKKWYALDDDLKENYRDSIEWLLSEIEPMYAKASTPERLRISSAYQSILNHRSQLEDICIHIPTLSIKGVA